MTEEEDEFPRAAPGSRKVEVEPGLNRFVWDLRYPDASRFPGMIFWAGNVRGPDRLTGQVSGPSDSGRQGGDAELRRCGQDPRLATTPEEYARQLAMQLQIRDKLTQANDGVIEIREVKKQLEPYEKGDNKTVSEAAKELAKKLTAVEEELYQTKNRSSQDPLNYPIKLNNKIAALGTIVGMNDRVRRLSRSRFMKSWRRGSTRRWRSSTGCSRTT